MGKVYSVPFDPPHMDWSSDWQKQEKEYLDKLTAWCKENVRGRYKGKVVQFPAADVYAFYMILSLKHLELIHVPLGDAWQYPYIERLSAPDIRKEADIYANISKIFGGE